MVVNVNDIVLLAPSARDAKYYRSYLCISNYGNAYNIVFNITKSQVMFYATLKMGQPVNISLGDTVKQSYKYVGHK